jgi:hypothetical protein
MGPLYRCEPFQPFDLSQLFEREISNQASYISLTFSSPINLSITGSKLLMTYCQSIWITEDGVDLKSEAATNSEGLLR